MLDYRSSVAEGFDVRQFNSQLCSWVAPGANTLKRQDGRTVTSGDTKSIATGRKQGVDELKEPSPKVAGGEVRGGAGGEGEGRGGGRGGRGEAGGGGVGERGGEVELQRRHRQLSPPPSTTSSWYCTRGFFALAPQVQASYRDSQMCFAQFVNLCSSYQTKETLREQYRR